MVRTAPIVPLFMSLVYRGYSADMHTDEIRDAALIHALRYASDLGKNHDEKLDVEKVLEIARDFNQFLNPPPKTRAELPSSS